ncbi:cation:proton antiporter [Rhodocaloribacter litoris]|uniref:cation:proton antiporter domain-containing protein n=1 Tax=Rhodocaloribacter litoris TaxID=2558931 RepID=UPI001420A001|nr:cation:proton antiporter [Rhodocaloribacter litoris]QXD14854.1 cation:proton antiporter [Rhodocaloribacter litoris]
MQQIVIGIVSVIVLGISAQWLAWRFKLPSILLLLVFGFLAGPVTRLLPPESLQSDWVFAFVSLSIGIILFEGGLSLRLPELREVGKVVFNLITIGVLVTWVLAGLAAYYVAGFNLGLSIQIGAILTVTGPTVVVPLLRHVRPSGRVGAVAKWEGITVDPVGAILAVLVLETILLLNQGASVVEAGGGVSNAAVHAVEGLLLTIAISVGISVIGAALLILVLHRRLVPDYLQSSIALMVVVGTFALSNVLQEESGLLEVTLMGIMMANQKYVPVRRITEFKEDLQVLLIACLFIVLSARLELEALDYLDERALLFLGLLVLVVRPVAVWLSSLRTNLNWREKVFLSWMAPRGIVAAAVASLFAFRLEPIYPGQVDGLVPVVFLVIVGTVTVYGLTISPLARYLGLAEPNPQGVLMLGAHLWARRMAALLQELGFKVLLIDSNLDNVERARRGHLPAVPVNALSESVLDELDLSGMGRFLALTPNDEVNALAALHFAEVFESTSVYQLAGRPENLRDPRNELPSHLRGRPLFGGHVTFSMLNDRFNQGGELAVVELSEKRTFEALQAEYDGDVVLLFVVRNGNLIVNAEEGQVTPQPGDRVMVFLPPRIREQAEAAEVSFEHLVTRAFVLDLEEALPFEELVEEVAALFAQRLPVTAARLARGFLDGARYGGMPVTRGMALPHLRVPEIEEPELVLVRCRDGIHAPRYEAEGAGEENGGEAGHAEKVYAVFFLVSPEDNPGKHLRTLANLASRIDESGFRDRWLAAGDAFQLKETLLDRDHYLVVTIREDDETSAFAGRDVEDLNLPPNCAVALVQRQGKQFTPSGYTQLHTGDRIIIVGDVAGIRALRDRLHRRAARRRTPVN